MRVKLITEIGLFLLVLGTPVAIGGVHKPTILVACILSCATFLSAWWYRGRQHQGLHITWFGGVLLAAAGYTVLQMIPLPLPLLKLIAPATVEVLGISLAPLGGLPAYHPISLDPGSTLWETLKIGTCALTFIVCHNVLHSSRRARRLLGGLVCVCVVVTFLGFVGAVLAPNKHLLWYSPEQRNTTTLIATCFVNGNHATAFLNMGLLIGLGLALHRSAPTLQRKVIWGLAAVFLGGGSCLLLSRGGLLALALGLGIFSALWLKLDRRRTPQRSQLVVIVGGAALFLGLASWLAFDAILAALMQTFPAGGMDLGKIEQWPSGLSMLKSNLWTGVGRGAFISTFPRYIEGALVSGTYSHMENQFLQLPIEWGILVGGGLILATAVALFRWIRSSVHSLQLAVAAALAGLAAHNALDFSLEMLGIAVPAAALAGYLSAADKMQRARNEKSCSSPDKGWTFPRILLLVIPVMLLSLAAWAAAAWPTDPKEDADHLTRLIREKAEPAQVLRLAREVIRRHPAHYFPHLIIAHQKLHLKQPDTLASLNRAQRLYPQSPLIHQQIAQTLLQFGRRQQALFEFGLSLKYQKYRGNKLNLFLSNCTSPEDLTSLMPEDADQQAEILMIYLRLKDSSLEEKARADIAFRFIEQSRRRWPMNEKLKVAQLRILSAKDPSRAVDLAQEMVDQSPSLNLYQVWSEVALSPQHQVKILLQAKERYPGEVDLDLSLARAYLDAGQLKNARKVAEDILKQVASSSAMADAHALLAKIFQADGRINRARYEAQQARDLRRW